MASRNLVDTNLANSGFATLLDFQTAYGLPQTGVLDTDTVATLNKRRCPMNDVDDPLQVRDRVSGAPQDASRRDMSAVNRVLGSRITFSFLSYTNDMNARAQRKCIIRAFNSWQRVLPVQFKWERRGRAARNADMRIGFHRGDHGDGAVTTGTVP